MLKRIALAVACALGVATVGVAHADDTAKYEVTITNITKGQSFTPLLVVTHKGNVSMFTLGEPASAGLERMAEGGDTSLLLDELMTYPGNVGGYATAAGAAGLLVPGESTTVVVEAGRYHRFLSIAGMFLPTNDTFVALNGVRLPRYQSSRMALGYDAGTEFNDQNCKNIPGPRCGGIPFSDPADTDEGYVYVSNGFHDLPKAEEGDGEVLGPFAYDWRNPVARVVVRRLRY